MSIDIRHLNIDIDGKPIVTDISLNVADGERVGLIGSSGSGKSMISKAILGLLPLNAGVCATGSIRLAGTELLGADDTQLAGIRGSAIGTIFQNPDASLNPVLRVRDQIELPLKLHYDLSKQERRERMEAMLRKVGLDEQLASAFPSELSGGQQQRVCIATALITSPRFIIADEPTTALDSVIQRQIIDLLVSLVNDAHASMLFITHDFAVLRRATTRCYVIESGTLVESGSTKDLLEHPTSLPAKQLVKAANELTLSVADCGGEEER